MASPDQVPPGYVYHEYPKCKYHADGTRSRIVPTTAAEEALGPWWFNSPSDADAAVASALQEVALSITTDPVAASDLLAVHKPKRVSSKKSAENTGAQV